MRIEVEELSIVCLASLLFLPLGVYCSYLILFRAVKLQCRSFVILVLLLFMINLFTYPIGRAFFYFGLTTKIEFYFTVCSVLNGVAQSCLSMSLWLFSIKMWALS